jgi:RecA/RadA recombinase
MVEFALIIPTGVSSLDLILNGGLHTGYLTHAFGEAAAGKTTLALHFVNAACRLDVGTVYVNSEGESPIERLEQITNKKLDAIENLVTILSPKSFSEQGTLIDDLDLYSREGTRLVVVDTLTRLYRAALEDKKTNYAAHRELNTQMGILKGLARERNMAVMVLNQVRGRMDESQGFEPVARNIMEFYEDYSVRLKVGRGIAERIVERLVPEGEPSKSVMYLAMKGFTAKRSTEENSEMESEESLTQEQR